MSLVLTRKKNESLMIGDNVKITVGSIIGNRVQLVFEAPDSVSILRQEVYDKKQKERLTEEAE